MRIHDVLAKDLCNRDNTGGVCQDDALPHAKLLHVGGKLEERENGVLCAFGRLVRAQFAGVFGAPAGTLLGVVDHLTAHLPVLDDLVNDVCAGRAFFDPANAITRECLFQLFAQFQFGAFADHLGTLSLQLPLQLLNCALQLLPFVEGFGLLRQNRRILILDQRLTLFLQAFVQDGFVVCLQCLRFKFGGLLGFLGRDNLSAGRCLQLGLNSLRLRYFFICRCQSTGVGLIQGLDPLCSRRLDFRIGLGQRVDLLLSRCPSFFRRLLPGRSFAPRCFGLHRFNRCGAFSSYYRSLLSLDGSREASLSCGSPTRPPVTWRFCARTAVRTSPAVMPKEAILSGSSQSRIE